MADQVLLKNTFDPLLKKTYAEFVEFKKELDANHTRTLRGPHLTALFEDWLMGKSERHVAANVDDAQRPAA